MFHNAYLNMEDMLKDRKLLAQYALNCEKKKNCQSKCPLLSFLFFLLSQLSLSNLLEMLLVLSLGLTRSKERMLFMNIKVYLKVLFGIFFHWFEICPTPVPLFSHLWLHCPFAIVVIFSHIELLRQSTCIGVLIVQTHSCATHVLSMDDKRPYISVYLQYKLHQDVNPQMIHLSC